MTDILTRYESRDTLRFLTCGSVDDGKSTLIGRMLYDSGAAYDDQLDAARRATRKRGAFDGDLDFSFLVDGLEAEREQGITIDVAWRYFSTARRNFIIADTPGHVQYTRNMATGASHCNLAVILVDARLGVLPQTRRHAFVASLLGIRHLVVAVNKMDAVDWSEESFDAIRAEVSDFAARLQYSDLEFVPVSALRGDNVVHRSERMPWYEGRPLLDLLENVHVASDANLIDFRLPVQLVLRASTASRAYAGTIASGVIRTGDRVAVLPSMRETRVVSIAAPGGPIDEAHAPMAVAMTLADEVDVSRGDVLAPPNNVPELTRELEAMVVWMSERTAARGGDYMLKQGTAQVPATLAEIRYRTNVDTLRREDASQLALNEIGRVRIEASRALAIDPYARNRATGAFILIDRITNETAGAGMIIARETALHASSHRVAIDARTNVHAKKALVSREEKALLTRQTPFVVWLTGLPRSGKSSIACALEKALYDRGMLTQVLDGENLRLGLSADLGFSLADRREAARRAAEAARLVCGLGAVAIVALVSPSAGDREAARQSLGELPFVEVFCDAPLEVCEARDSDHLFERARAGELFNVTGIDLPYERPEEPELVLATDRESVEDNVARVVKLLVQRGLVR
ncbi:MAG: adenylyl-sulfate kinase [Acidobacteria bacterium]|nr:adenylyl-sulfate kinase [Acidobacteriota bacterium]